MRKRLVVKRKHIKEMRALVRYCKAQIKLANYKFAYNPLNATANRWREACTKTVQNKLAQKSMPHCKI